MSIQEVRDGSERRQQVRQDGGLTLALVVGGLCGLAWAAGLRGFMAQIAGSESGVDWAGTFGWILVPGISVGALLGWAEHLRSSGGRPGWRWLALSPLLFSAILFSRPLDLLSILEDGVGGGAIGVSLYGMLGGYALSGGGPRRARIVSGAVARTAIPIWALTVTSFAGPGLALDTPRGAWIAVYYWSFLAVLMLACAIPHRAVTPQHPCLTLTDTQRVSAERPDLCPGRPASRRARRPQRNSTPAAPSLMWLLFCGPSPRRRVLRSQRDPSWPALLPHSGTGAASWPPLSRPPDSAREAGGRVEGRWTEARCQRSDLSTLSETRISRRLSW